MNQAELEMIVSQVTQQVLQAMNGTQSCDDPGTEGMARVLVVGELNRNLPEEIQRDAVLLDIEDYRKHQNILRYDRVVIAHLNITQLADLAQARISDEVTCVVLHALLNGIETLILDDALSFRKYAGKGSTALYHLLESYAQTLQVFGVKPVGRRQAGRQELPAPKPPKFKAPEIAVPKGSACPSRGRLITETEALELLQGGTTVHLPAGAIVTPLARDLFAQTGAQLIQD